MNNKKKGWKRALAWLLAIAAVAGIGGGVWRYAQQNREPVPVYAFENVGMTEFWGDSQESYGPISTDRMQSVFLSDTQMVTQVYVSQGDTVKKGDLLLSFDTTLSELELERKRLEVEKLKIDLEDAQKQLQQLQWMSPRREPKPVEEKPQDLGRKLKKAEVVADRRAVPYAQRHDGSDERRAMIFWMTQKEYDACRQTGIPQELIEEILDKAAQIRKEIMPDPGEQVPSDASALPEGSQSATEEAGEATSEATSAPTEAPKPTETTEAPKPTETTEAPKPTETTEAPKVTEATEAPKPIETTEAPKVTEATEESSSEESTPEESTPEESTPGESTPEESTPEESTPEESTPGESTPEESTPGESTPEESTPGESTPGETQPTLPGPIDPTEETTQPSDEATGPAETTEETTEPTEETTVPTEPEDLLKDLYIVIKVSDQNCLKGTHLVWQGVRLFRDGKIFFFDAGFVEDYSLPEEKEEPPEDLGGIYSYSELQQMRKEQEAAVKAAELSLKMADTEYAMMLREVNDGYVLAEIDGEILSLLSEDEAKIQQLPMLKLSGGGGYYMEGSISELEKDRLEIGQEVTINDWQTGMQYTGTVQAVMDYPTSNGWRGMGNPNASYYPFTVFIDSSADLQEGRYVSCSFSTGGESGIYLQNPFLRTEKGQTYVMVQGEDGRLEKRFVVPGKSLWGSYTEIKSGLTPDSKIAFPYGKTIKEGAPTQDGDISELYNY